MTSIHAHRRTLLTCAFVMAILIAPLARAVHPHALATAASSRDAAAPDGIVLPNGRLVTPAGTTVNLGDFPIGLAISPDGHLAVAINSGQGQGLNGGFGSYCAPTPCPYVDPAQPLITATIGYSNTPTYDNSLSVVDLRSGEMHQVTAVPTSYDPLNPRYNFFYAGVAFSPDGKHLYASGGGNDAIYDFPVHDDVVASSPAYTATLPDTVQNQPPLILYGPGHAFTKSLAVTPDGKYLLVSHEFQNTLDIVDTHTYSVTQVPLSDPVAVGGAHPYGVVVSHDGSTAYVAEQGFNQVAVIKLAAGTGTLVTAVGVGSRPTALALSPDGTQLYVTNANDDTLSILTVDSTGIPTLANTVPLHAFPGEQTGSVPNAVAVSPDGQRLYVALAGDNAVAVLGTAQGFDSGATGTSTPGRASPAPQSFVLGGMIPAGWYPSAVATSADGKIIYVVSAKGLGSRYLPPYVDRPRHGAIWSAYYYVGNNMPGLLQEIPTPDSQTLLMMLQRVRRNIFYATQSDDERSPHNPIPQETITGTTSLTMPVTTPISYVIEIVRENRTFDQELGDIGVDEGRSMFQVDGYAGYSIFGRRETPNAHALVGDPTLNAPYTAYATSDNFYSDGEISVQGHWWTTGANSDDYLEKAWPQYYSTRYHFNDPVAAIAQPDRCSLFQSALARENANPPGTFTFRNYGELVGLKIDVPFIPFPVGSAHPPCTVSLVQNSDLTLPLILASINLDHDDRTVAQQFLSDVGLDLYGHVITPTRTLRNFSYIWMSGDHTGGLAFTNTPRSRVAQNDAALGMIVQSLSRSPYWPHTAIFVMEDDSQDGLDHEDGHRNLLYVISPYAKHIGPDGKPGYVGHLHYSQSSVVKTIELLLGLPYLSSYDQNASPLYDLFQNKDGTPGHTLTPVDLAPYTLQPAPSFIDEQSSQYTKSLGPIGDVLTAESQHLNLSAIDRAGPMLEIIDWQLAHPHSALPPQLVHELQVWDQAHGVKDGD